MARVREPQLSFADCEFRRQGIRLDPTLQTIADFLDQHAQLIQAVRGDLQRGLKKPVGLAPLGGGCNKFNA